MRKWLREPLLHFLLLALLLYAAYALMHPGAAGDAQVIRVDRKALVDFLQYRAQAFAPGRFDKAFDALDAPSRQALLDDYVREEALLREAHALGLEDGDYVIRQRLVQRVGFLIEDAAAPREPPDEATLEAWFRSHAADYHEPATYTFTHVFFDRELHGEAKAESLARQMARTLNARRAVFSDAARHGDRFPFLLNYVERTEDFVQSQFGAAFVKALETLPADGRTWQGPLRSEHGWHLVLMTAHIPARLPALASLRGRVLDDWRREQSDTARRAAIQRLVGRYRVERVGLDGPQH